MSIVLVLLAEGVARASTCYGTTSNGRLEDGVRLPASGQNFSVYSRLGHLVGRTYVHEKLRQVVLSAYEELYNAFPHKVFVYGETGWPQGGKFRPHRTHRNGLSIDFLVPVLDRSGTSVSLPTHRFNQWGYAIEFDREGRWNGMRIDFEAMAQHLYQLHKRARATNVDIARVVFDPKLQPFLWRTQRGDYLRQRLKFSSRRAWVRHDEHYHVDFKVACKSL